MLVPMRRLCGRFMRWRGRKPGDYLYVTTREGRVLRARLEDFRARGSASSKATEPLVATPHGKTSSSAWEQDNG